MPQGIEMRMGMGMGGGSGNGNGSGWVSELELLAICEMHWRLVYRSAQVRPGMMYWLLAWSPLVK